MSKPIPVNAWQAENTPDSIPLHVRRNIAPGEGGCWLWTRSKSPDGYGWASYKNRTCQAHRLVYTFARGPVPEGLHLDHLCRVRHCVNPDHLEPVTPRENLARGDTPTAWKHCQRRGGDYSQYHGQRRCLACLDEYRTRQRKEPA